MFLARRGTGLALSRAQIVIFMGGLGPTEDDLTREAVADALGLDGPPAPGGGRPGGRQGGPGGGTPVGAGGSRGNHWHGAGVGCEDGMGAGSARDVWLVW